MSDSKRADNDPSMDDILASIRKIISDDEARAASGGAPTTPASDSVSSTPAAGEGSRAVRFGAPPEDVLLLTDLIEEPKDGPVPARPIPMPLPRIDPVKAADMPQPNIEPAPTARPPASDATLIGAAVAGATSAAFERLSEAMKQGAPQPAATDPGPVLGASGKTIEDMVRELLRPMLKDWLEKNLPPLVERVVEREIVRLTRR